MNNQQNIILAAIETSTSNYSDLDDDGYLAEAIHSQIQLLAGLDPDQIDINYDLH